MSFESPQGTTSAHATSLLETAPPAVKMRNIRIRFGGVTALSGVDFDVREGEVHGWCGENGAGKTTAARILARALEPTAGSVEVLGSAIDPRPASAIRAGVRMITQEISLFPPLTVAENLVTGGAGHSERFINWRSLRRRAEEYLRLIGLDVDPAAPLAGLTIGEQQLVEIARAMFSGRRVVILHEPTSALGAAEAARLLRRAAGSWSLPWSSTCGSDASRPGPHPRPRLRPRAPRMQAMLRLRQPPRPYRPRSPPARARASDA